MSFDTACRAMAANKPVAQLRRLDLPQIQNPLTGWLVWFAIRAVTALSAVGTSLAFMFH